MSAFSNWLSMFMIICVIMCNTTVDSPAGDRETKDKERKHEEHRDEVEESEPPVTEGRKVRLQITKSQITNHKKSGWDQ